MVSRHTSWADTSFGGTSLVAATPQAFNLLADAPISDTMTVMRIIGSLEVGYLVTTTRADSLSVVSVGIGVSSAEAFSVAATAGLPNPTQTDQYPPRGWLYVQAKAVRQVINPEGLVDHWATFEFDLRGARKVDKGTLFMIIEQDNITVGGAMQLVGRIRTLCKT